MDSEREAYRGLVRILSIAMLREDATDGAQSWCPKFYVKESEMGYKLRDEIKTKERVRDVISMLHTLRIIFGEFLELVLSRSLYSHR